jgi:hypothetical protein
MSGPTLAQRIEWIEAGYEYLLAYAAQGRREDSGSDARRMLSQMQTALDGLGEEARRAFAGSGSESAAFFEAVSHDARVAGAAIALVLSRPAISSLLVDNLNASVHLRALLTDLFLLDQASKTAG